MDKRYELLKENFDIDLDNLDPEEMKQLVEAFRRGEELPPDKETLAKQLVLFSSNYEDFKIGNLMVVEFLQGKRKIMKIPAILSEEIKVAIPLYSFECRKMKRRRFII